MKTLKLLLSIAAIGAFSYAEEQARDPFGGPVQPTQPDWRRTVNLGDIQTLIGFFALKFRDEEVEPLSDAFEPKDIHTLHAITGVHRVVWEGNDSLHAMQFYVKDGETLWRYSFNFTLSPPLWEREFANFNEVFGKRRLTQYCISRINDSIKPPTEAHIEDILIESRTDREAQDQD